MVRPRPRSATPFLALAALPLAVAFGFHAAGPSPAQGALTAIPLSTRSELHGWDIADPLRRARVCIVTPQIPFSKVLLYAFAEPSINYDRPTIANSTISRLPSGVSVATSQQSISGSTGPALYLGGSVFPDQNSTNENHYHAFSASVPFLYTHEHGVSTSPSAVSRATGTLPSNTSLFIDDVNHTSSVLWATHFPSADRQLLIDGQDISAFVGAAGVHWIEIGSDQAGSIRFLLVLR